MRSSAPWPPAASSIGGARGIAHDLAHGGATPPTVDTGARLVALVLAVAIAVTITLAAYVYAGTPYAILAAVTWAAALGGWLRTTFRGSGPTPVAFNLYVATLVALMALYAEQWYRRFPSTLMRFFPMAYPPGVGIGEHTFIAVFPLATSAVMTLGALAYYRRAPIGEFAAWTVFAWGCVAPLSVYLTGPLAGHAGQYVGGMITAPIALVIALAGARRLARADGEVRA